MKEGASVLGAEMTESVAVRPLESDFHVSYIIPTWLRGTGEEVGLALLPPRALAAFLAVGAVQP